MKKENKHLIFGSGFAGVLGSLCCIGPVVIVLFGLGSVSTALSFGTFSGLFLAIAFIFFGLTVFFYLRKKNCCSVKGMKQNWKIITKSFIFVVVLLLLLKYWIAPLLAQIAYR